MVGKVKFEARIRELVENLPDLVCWSSRCSLSGGRFANRSSSWHCRLLAIVRDDEVCRRLMTTPGVGPVVALTYVLLSLTEACLFRKSKAVGAVFGLTCAEVSIGRGWFWNGRISRCGDEMMRTMLYEAAQKMPRLKNRSWLNAWAMQIARRRGMKKAIVALACWLAV